MKNRANFPSLTLTVHLFGILQLLTFIQIPDDGLLLQEVHAELLTEAERQHVMSERSGNTDSAHYKQHNPF